MDIETYSNLKSIIEKQTKNTKSTTKWKGRVISIFFFLWIFLFLMIGVGLFIWNPLL